MGLRMQSHGIQSMLKESHKHLSGLNEAVLKNIDACKPFSTFSTLYLKLQIYKAKNRTLFLP